MIGAINKIFDLLKAVWDFVQMVFEGFLDLIRYLETAVTLLPNFLSWLPATLIAGLVSIISIAIIYKILGRDT